MAKVNEDGVLISGDDKIVSKIIEALKEVYDPEIPVNIYDLGLIYEIHVDRKNNGRFKAKIVMTITAIGCPVTGLLASYVEESIRDNVPEVDEVEVEITFDPPWTPDRVTREGRELLKAMYGYDVVEQWKKQFSEQQWPYGQQV